MTIALRIELKEDWGQNAPAVRVMARTLRHGDYQVARLTPRCPAADVCITRDADLYLELEQHAADVIEGHQSPPSKDSAKP